MNKEDVFSKLAKSLGEEFEIDLDKFKPNAKIKDDLSLDSLDIVDVVVIVENEFHIKLQSSDFKSMKTYSDLVDFIHNRI